jgi:hypothetical protein
MAGYKSWNKNNGTSKSSIQSSGKLWSSKELLLLKELAGKNKPTGWVALELGRSRKSIYSKASKQGIQLQPSSQRPYRKVK